MERRRLGRTGHETSVLVFGAAGLGSVSQEAADRSLAYAWDSGINHFDTAASYGDAELRMGGFVAEHRDAIFLATKTTERTADAAWAELQRSLELLRTDRIDLWQVHAVHTDDELDKVFAPGGCLEAFTRARDEGLVSWIGITGHTERAPAIHAEALRRHNFDSVLTPLNFQLYSDPRYAADFDALCSLIEERDAALRTIKAIARRPWPTTPTLATWYEPLTDPDDIRAAISWVLGSFPLVSGLATAGETSLLPRAVDAERDLTDVASAAERLSAIDDYRTIFA